MEKKKRKTTQFQMSIEETYQKKSHLEQILHRPDTYIGSIEKEDGDEWVWDMKTNRMVKRRVTFVPGLLKIFDEILVNASDNAQRDMNTKTIKVNIDASNNMISIWNDGESIPIQQHSEYKCYVPELIFGHLLTSSNYDDSKDKTTGGRNGYGAKLANIFSVLFRVETNDTKQTYVQEWTNNMNDCSQPKIRSKKKNVSFTKVIFQPDLKRFGMEETGLDEDIVAMMAKRVVDIAGSFPRLNVYLNNQKVKINTFKGYVRLFFPDNENHRIVTEKINERWEIGASVSNSGSFEHASLVNGISTKVGGTHVNHVSSQICKYIAMAAKKKNAKFNMSMGQIKAQLFVFINCLIVNPKFDSQSKVNLTTHVKSFGSECQLSKQCLTAIARTGLLDQVLAYSEVKNTQDLKKTDGRKKKTLIGVPKLEDANWAGTAKSSQCTLILTEGDSALALAVSGLSIVGRDRFGVYPLRGKFFNVRGKSSAQINGNGTVTALKKILGLQSGIKYDNIDSLRYGHVMIMADQDQDGSHIKGLVLNLFQTCWPELFRLPGFLQEFITPIVKVKKNNQSISFYTLPEFETWKEENELGKGWSIKYYKGLATSTAKEGQEYFQQLDKHRIPFAYESQQDDDDFELVFDSKKADQRKTWLGNFVPGTFLNQNDRKELTYHDFVHKELILYSMSSNVRSIPSVMDGLKPGQRKIVHACFDKNVTKEIKVAQLSGHVMAYAYHHGDQSLNETIVGLAQNFVGSNNLNLLIPSGQFGTRHAAGKNHSSARYIFTCLDKVTRFLFRSEDDPILQYLNDDGLFVEPKYFAPIIPMVLVNGSSGIGTGWSTQIPNFNPLDLISNIRHLLHDEPTENIQPWYLGFRGNMLEDDEGDGYVSIGVVNSDSKHKFIIDELPIGGKCTNSYKDFLEKLVEQKKIKTFTSHHTDNLVRFEITVTSEQHEHIHQQTPVDFFKLKSNIKLSNMVLFNTNGQLHKYESVNDILQEFYQERLQLYATRKKHQIHSLTHDLTILQNKVRFILAVVDGNLEIRRVPKQDLIGELKRQNYDEMDDQYDYLLSMKLWSLTHEKVNSLNQKKELKMQELKTLESKTIQELWLEDLKELEHAIREKFNEFDNLLDNERRMMCRKKKRSLEMNYDNRFVKKRKV